MNSGPREPAAPGRRYVRLVIGYSAGITTGLAPALGGSRIPFLGALFPSGFCVLLSALATPVLVYTLLNMQMRGGGGAEQEERATLRRRATWCLELGFPLLMAAYFLLVVQVGSSAKSIGIPAIIGWSRTSACECKTQEDSVCVGETSVSESALDICWGSRSRALSKGILAGLYATVMYGFGLMIALIAYPASAGRPKRKRRRGAQPKPA